MADIKYLDTTGLEVIKSILDNALAGKAAASHGTHVPGIKSASSVSTLGWSANSNYVPDLSMLAYWNGAYSGTSSNLTYCTNGTIIGSNNIGSQSVNYANTAGSVEWSNVSNKLNFSGASSSSAGSQGLVPAPAKGQQSYLLQGNGSWISPYWWSADNIHISSGSSVIDLNNRSGGSTFVCTSWDYAGSSKVNNQPWGNGGSSAATITAFPGSYPWQLCRFYSTNDLYIRGYYSGTGWTSWQKLALSGEAQPASDVYDWAKAASRPTYNKSDVGLGNVDNTADANKSVAYAASAGALYHGSGGISSYSDQGLLFSYRVSSSDTNFSTSNNANGCITMHLHEGNYFAQLGFSASKDRFYTRTFNGGSLNTTTDWNTIAYTSDIPSIPTSLPANGGAADTAVSLTTKNIGSATNPIYWNANGKPAACTYSLNKTVPSDALFTDTNTWRGITDSYNDETTSSAISLSQTGGKNLYNLILNRTSDCKKYYDINLEHLSTSYFYPVVFAVSDIETDCEIHSPNRSGSHAWNQNRIHFLLTTQGWSDTGTSFTVLSHAWYDSSEVTIGAIGRGNRQGCQAVWLRGGNAYRFICNKTPSLKESGYTYDGETYTIGTDYFGGSNANVTILWDANGPWVNRVAHTSDIPSKISSFENDSGYITASGSITGSSGSCTGNAATADTATAAGSAGKLASSASNIVTSPGTGFVQYARFQSGSNGNLPVADNANGVLTFNTHSGNYHHQLGFTGKGFYYRKLHGSALNTTTAWTEVSLDGHTHTSFNNNISVTGSVTASAGFFDNSDERLKDIIDTVNVDIDKLSELRKVYFNFKNDADKKHIGVIAQDVQKIYPEIVEENTDGMLTVDYSKLSVIALDAVDQLNQRNKELEDRLNKIENLLKDKGIL